MRRLITVLAALFTFAAPAAAERFVLRYDATGMGVIPLGGIVVDADVRDDGYDVATSLQSSGFINVFERTAIEASASGDIHNGAVFWRRYDLDHRYSRKRRQIALQVGEGGAVSAEITPNYRLWGQPATNDAQRRLSRDPLSSMIAMSIDVGQTRRCAGAYPTFDGRFHYLLEIADGQIESFDDAGYQGDVLKCSLAYVAVAGYEPRDAGRTRIPHGEVWFALMPDSNFAPVVRITTPWPRRAVIRLTEFRRARVDVQYTSAPTP